MLVGHVRVVVVIDVLFGFRPFFLPLLEPFSADDRAALWQHSRRPPPATGSRVPPDDAAGSASRGVADIEPDGMSAPPRAAREQPTRHSPTVRLEPSASDETPAHVPTARPSCQNPSAQAQSGQPQPGRPHGQTAAPSKPSVIIPEVSPEARPDAELAAKLAARLDGTAASQSSEEPTKPRATYSPEQLRLLQVRGSRGIRSSVWSLRQLQACYACSPRPPWPGGIRRVRVAKQGAA